MGKVSKSVVAAVTGKHGRGVKPEPKTKKPNIVPPSQAAPPVIPESVKKEQAAPKWLGTTQTPTAEPSVEVAEAEAHRADARTKLAKLFGNPFDPRVDGVCRTASDALTEAAKDFADVEIGATVPQAVLTRAHEFQVLFSRLKGACDIFDALLKAHYNGRSAFEDGPVAVTAETKAGVARPKWKDEAVSRAEECAQLQHQAFDLDRYVKAVQETYPAVPTLSVETVYKVL